MFTPLNRSFSEPSLSSFHSHTHNDDKDITPQAPCLTRCVSHTNFIGLDHPSLLKYEELPIYMRDNEYIIHGYRANFTYLQCIKSLFSLHNETFNIWSHLLGLFFFFFLLSCYLYYYYLPSFQFISSPSYFLSFNYSSYSHISSKDSLYLNTPRLGPSINSIYSNKTINYPPFSTYDYSTHHINRSPYLVSLLTSSLSILDKYAHHLPSLNISHSFQTSSNQTQQLLSGWNQQLDKLRDTFSQSLYNSFSTNNITLFSNIHLSLSEFKMYINNLLISSNSTDNHHYNFSITLLSHLSAPFHIILDNIDNAVIDGGVILPYYPIAIFLLSAMACLGFSTFFHLFLCESSESYHFFQKLDYAGICILIAGSCFPVVYYSYYCNSFWLITYLVYVHITSYTGFIMTMIDRLMQPQYRWIRATVLISCALAGAIPMIHLKLVNGEYPFISWYVLSMGVIYIFGATMYSLRFPECIFPGKFDFMGHSHNILHISVVLAAFVLFYGITLQYNLRKVSGCINEYI